MAWATEAEVLNQTGVTVSAETLAIASAMVDTFTGADEDLPVDAISVKDRKTLRKATAWQAAWIPGKPGILTERENAESVGSDTQSIKRGDRADIMLAPLARREILNLSWVGTRSVWVPPASPAVMRANFLNEASDVHGTWYPIP